MRYHDLLLRANRRKVTGASAKTKQKVTLLLIWFDGWLNIGTSIILARSYHNKSSSQENGSDE